MLEIFVIAISLGFMLLWIDWERGLCLEDSNEENDFWKSDVERVENELFLNKEDIEDPELMVIIIIKLLTVMITKIEGFYINEFR